MGQQRPTLAQVRKWPAAVSVADGARALGVSRASLYAAITAGTCPVDVIMVGRRKKVLTHSLVRVLEGSGTEAKSA